MSWKHLPVTELRGQILPQLGAIFTKITWGRTRAGTMLLWMPGICMGLEVVLEVGGIWVAEENRLKGSSEDAALPKPLPGASGMFDCPGMSSGSMSDAELASPEDDNTWCAPQPLHQQPRSQLLHHAEIWHPSLHSSMTSVGRDISILWSASWVKCIPARQGRWACLHSCLRRAARRCSAGPAAPG